jgi:hypothetical protein
MNISAPLSQGVEDLTPALALPFRAKSQKGEIIFYDREDAISVEEVEL